MHARLRRTVLIALPVLVILYGAALRFDALTLSYGPVTRPDWLRSLQEHSLAPLRAIRPASVHWDAVPYYPHRDGVWTHYTSDPYTYLIFAREMRSFYAAHYREPLFPFVTKVALWLLHDQDVAVSFASTLFSLLTVVGTYLLGAYAFSRGVGLGAALAMAIEYDVISAGITGGRDDAFACMAVWCAYAILRCVRAPSRRNALLLGVFAGAACLVRITSLSFLVPALVCLLFMIKDTWRQRARVVGLAALTMTVIVGPYLFNCWRAFGDPLYSINYHTGNYLLEEGQRAEAHPSVAAYIRQKWGSRPYQTLDTVALGMTSYPFTNKWLGFDEWVPSLGRWLSYAALAGLVLFAGSPSGRVLLLVLVTSLIPFAVTWRLAGDWRFTQHAYAFFLVASFAAIAQVAAWVTPPRVGGTMRLHRPDRRAVVGWSVVLGAVGLAAWIITRVLPVLVVKESLVHHEDVTIEAGARDGAFFGAGWLAPTTGGAVTARTASGASAVVWLPLPRADEYSITLRLDPFPRPSADRVDALPVVRVSLNGTPLQTIALQWNPDRVGAYDLVLPRALVTVGTNRLTLATDAPGANGAGSFRLWYVRVRPPAQAPN